MNTCRKVPLQRWRQFALVSIKSISPWLLITFNYYIPQKSYYQNKTQNIFQNFNITYKTIDRCWKKLLYKNKIWESLVMLPLRHSTRAFLYSGTKSQTSFPKATPAALPCKDESACRVQRVTKRCRLSWLTNSSLVYEPKCERRGELCGISQWVQQYRSPNKLWRSNSIFNLWWSRKV
jgi:hypothetical protein